MFKPKPVEPLTLQVGRLHDVHVSAALRFLADHEPFRTYALAVMVGGVIDQLTHGACVLGIRNGNLAAYGGWIRVRQAEAEQWRQGLRAIPQADWSAGDAMISTVIAADDSADLSVLLRGISDRCRGFPVYRVRVFPDGREKKRAPITGRTQEALRGG